jgi:hypothetical protein
LTSEPCVDVENSPELALLAALENVSSGVIELVGVVGEGVVRREVGVVGSIWVEPSVHVWWSASRVSRRDRTEVRLSDMRRWASRTAMMEGPLGLWKVLREAMMGDARIMEWRQRTL